MISANFEKLRNINENIGKEGINCASTCNCSWISNTHAMPIKDKDLPYKRKAK